MSIDLPTLFLTSVIVTGLLGAFLLIVWRRYRGEREFAWWGVAYLCIAAGLFLLAARNLAPPWIVHVGNALTLAGAGVVWGGARVLTGRRISYVGVLAGTLVWAIAISLPAMQAEPMLRLALRSTIAGFYAWLLAYELWPKRNRDMSLGWVPALWPLLHGCFAITMLVTVWFSGMTRDSSVYDHPFVKLLAFEALIYSIVMGFLLAMQSTIMKASRHKAAALTDPLTGIANRRAFLEHFRTLRAPTGQGPRRLALLTFDLDSFKQVNDRFGHLVGDRALQIFAKVATRNLRSRDLIARLGGEEFAAALPDVDREQAQLIADRIRNAFAAETTDLVQTPITVSVGITLCHTGETDLASLLRAADQALYEAKARGGNLTVFQPQAA